MCVKLKKPRLQISTLIKYNSAQRFLNVLKHGIVEVRLVECYGKCAEDEVACEVGDN